MLKYTTLHKEKKKGTPSANGIESDMQYICYAPKGLLTACFKG